MEIKEVDPSKITIDMMNERQGGSADEEFVENVRATGRLVQPPLVRELNGGGMDAAMGAEYSVVVGGRRVDAATQAGLESIPVIVMPWDDTEALLSSITENIDAFRKEVDEYSRARALERLMDENSWTREDLSEKIGMSENWVRTSLEPVKDEWEGTKYSAKSSNNALEGDKNTDSGETESKVKKQEAVRRATLDATPEEREQVMDLVEEKGLSLHEVEEAKQQADRGRDLNEAIETVAKESKEPKEVPNKVSVRVRFTGDLADAIEAAGSERSASDEQIVRTAVEQWLESEGYL